MRLPHLFFGVAVDIRGIEEEHPELQRAMDELDGFVVAVNAAGVHIGDSQAHATESERRYFRPVAAESSGFHVSLL